MGFKILPYSEEKKAHWHLLQITRQSDQTLSQLNLVQKKLLNADYVLLRNRFSCKRVLLTGADQNPLIAATLFLPKQIAQNQNIKPSLGLIASHSKVTSEEVNYFWQALKNCVSSDLQGKDLLTPMNGHHYLGFSALLQQKDLYHPSKVGFLTSPVNSMIQKFFVNQKESELKDYRSYYALESILDEKRVQKLKVELQSKPASFSTRPFDIFYSGRDFAVMNQLVNECFTEHFDFWPLTAEENHDIMKAAVSLMQKGTFLFLLDGNKEIGFCYATMDYNQILKPQASDVVNITRALTLRSKMNRARIIHIGVLKEYRGQKLVKYLRHQVLLNLYALGARTVESSYIDEGNVVSLGNSRSTGGELLNRFSLLQLRSKLDQCIC